LLGWFAPRLQRAQEHHRNILTTQPDSAVAMADDNATMLLEITNYGLGYEEAQKLLKVSPLTRSAVMNAVANAQD
jgi:hypothetical protein